RPAGKICGISQPSRSTLRARGTSTTPSRRGLSRTGAIRVWVHIADVSAYVPPGSLVDREAYRRGCSVYVPGAVEPMLPGSLSNQSCSLVPGQDRLAVTVEFVVAGGRAARPAFYRSMIRSDSRLEYGEVDRLFAGAARADGSWGPALD